MERSYGQEELWINMKKTKIMTSEYETGSVRNSGKKEVGSKSIFCVFCKHWVHLHPRKPEFKTLPTGKQE